MKKRELNQSLLRINFLKTDREFNWESSSFAGTADPISNGSVLRDG